MVDLPILNFLQQALFPLIMHTQEYLRIDFFLNSYWDLWVGLSLYYFTFYCSLINWCFLELFP